MQKAGICVTAGLDLDSHCAFPFQENIKAIFIKRDLADTAAEELNQYYSPGSVRVLAGCAPCQPFSTLSNGRDRQKSKKWPLIKEYQRVVDTLKPEIVTMENVPVLRSQSVFHEFVQFLKQSGYSVTTSVLDAVEYGVAQRRKRLVLLASRFGAIRIVSPQEIGARAQSVRDAIGHLPGISAGTSDPEDPLHRARSLTPMNLQRVRSSKPGGTWKDWPEEIRLPCHRKDTGATFQSVYGRLEWDKPASTMTTQAYNFGTGRYGHPDQDRALSLREMALLQSFPHAYKFIDPEHPVEFAPLGRLIGNAVPVELGYAIGRSIRAHVEAQASDGDHVG
jgi:DNA (cytosine-5)-methyltransferase 1